MKIVIVDDDKQAALDLKDQASSRCVVPRCTVA